MGMKRFYKNAAIEQQADGYAVLLDTRPVKTPAGKLLVLPTRQLSKAIADEWQAQGEMVVVRSMPLMQLAATTLDRVPLERAPMIDRLLAYAGSDLLCHRVADPVRLCDTQKRLFDPALAWLHCRYDINLHTTTELMAAEQQVSAMQRLTQVLEVLDDWALMGVQTAALASGSIVLALGLYEKQFTAAEVFEIAEVESTYQIEKWGTDIELVKRRNSIEEDLNSIERWFVLLQ